MAQDLSHLSAEGVRTQTQLAKDAVDSGLAVANAIQQLWAKYSSNKQGDSIEIALHTAKDAIKSGEKPESIVLAIASHSPAVKDFSNEQKQLFAKQTVTAARSLQDPVKVKKALQAVKPKIDRARTLNR